MNPPSITIVTPTLNPAAYIQATIDSVLSQNYPNLEYRVLDGGSNDGTQAILAQYGRQVAWRSGPDRGQSDAINRGWAESSGEILAWLNSDDLYLPGTLQRVGSYFAAHPEVEWVYGDCLIVDSAGIQIGQFPVRPYDYLTLVRETHDYLPQPATFIRRSLYQSVGGLDERLHFGMDFDYWLRAGLQHAAVYLAQPLAALRLHESAKSVAQLARFAQELIQIYRGYFARTDLPLAIRACQPIALSNIYLRAADCAFWGNDLGAARQHAIQSFLHRPFRPRRLWLFLLLGPLGRKLAEGLMKNPYALQGANP
jgi:glycosyltransferase involved in cell wall biosynthesis